MKAWRITGFATETLVAFVALTSCSAAVLALNASPFDDHYLDILTGIVAALLTGLVAYRFSLGTGYGIARTGWIIAGIALGVVALARLFEGHFGAVERTIHLVDGDDIALLLVLPVAITVAARTEGIGRNAMLLLAAAVLAQIVSTGLVLLDDPRAQTDLFGLEENDKLVDVAEFVFLQLYLIALAASGTPQPHLARGRTRSPSWLKRQGLTPKRFHAWHVRPFVWRLKHPGLAPEDYYADIIRRQIGQGHHPAIGRTARALRTPDELLNILRRHGLKPTDTVVDYGCGSFRLGAALIEHLEPGRYWGLDVLQDFLTLGLELLGADLVAEKKPNALLINAENLDRTRAAAPGYVVSWHVCSKVPPRRLHDYFGKMISLLGPESLLLVHFPETARRQRQSRFSWSHSRQSLAAVIREIDPGLEVRFAPVTPDVVRGVRETMVVVRRSRPH